MFLERFEGQCRSLHTLIGAYRSLCILGTKKRTIRFSDLWAEQLTIMQIFAYAFTKQFLFWIDVVPKSGMEILLREWSARRILPLGGRIETCASPARLQALSRPDALIRGPCSLSGEQVSVGADDLTHHGVGCELFFYIVPACCAHRLCLGWIREQPKDG